MEKEEIDIDEIKKVFKKGDNIKLGYSDKINDPAFKSYVDKSKKTTSIVIIVLALLFVVGFYIFGEVSNMLGNPFALILGILLALVTLIVGLRQMRIYKKTESWDGVIVDKKISDKKRTVGGGEDSYREKYKLYQIFVKDNYSKEYVIKAENSDTLYNYYNIGDKVRYHAGLDTYEKYDKTQDDTVLCVACKTMNDINNDACSKCSSPLLK